MLTAVERKWRFPTPGHQRVLKLRGDAQQIFVNGEFSGGSSGFWDYTIYVNPYMVVRPEGHYTKHIYVNSQRIASKIGNPQDYDQEGESEGDPTTLGSPLGKKVLLEEVVEENFTELFGSIPDIEPVADESLGMSHGGSGGEPHQYWFTADHLGSSAFVTDASGVAIQHLEYMAFGEVFVDQRRTGFGTPYKFNAKELDCESGYYYYSACYYDPRMAWFLSVDPLADKYTAWSPYNYVLGNPIRNIDPRGDTVKIVNNGTIHQYSPGQEYNGNDDYISPVVSQLNTLNENSDAGQQLVSSLSSSEGDYYYLNANPSSKDSAASFDAYAHEGGEGIRGVVYLPEGNSINDIAHESFHALQYETGLTDIKTDAAEVGAFLFESVITNDLNGFPDLHFGTSESTNLLYNGFNGPDYGTLVRSFQTSSKNSTGIYNNLKEVVPKSPLIKRYLPLK